MRFPCIERTLKQYPPKMISGGNSFVGRNGCLLRSQPPNVLYSSISSSSILRILFTSSISALPAIFQLCSSKGKIVATSIFSFSSYCYIEWDFCMENMNGYRLRKEWRFLCRFCLFVTAQNSITGGKSRRRQCKIFMIKL